MTDAAYTPRQARSLDHLSLATQGGWGELEKMFAPRQGKPSRNQPDDEVAMFLAALAREGRGRELLEWLMDITFRQPFRATGATIEETALLAATRQGIEGVGEVILAALRHGNQLLEERTRERSE